MSIRCRAENATVSAGATLLGCGGLPGGIALALTLGNSYQVRLIAGQSRITYQRGSEHYAGDPATDPFLSALRQLLEMVGAPLAGFVVTCRLEVPPGCGLGADTAAIIAGLALGRELLGARTEIPDSALLEVASSLGAQPLRAATLLAGGARISGDEQAENASSALALLPPPVTIFAAPGREREIPLEQLLPLEVGPEIALRQARASAALLLGLQAEPELLYAGTADYLVAPYLGTEYPASAELLAWLRKHHWPAFLSGNGPALAVFAELPEQLLAQADAGGWQVLQTAVEQQPLAVQLQP